ncbi:MAG: bifunctional [glutamine synthetase] adenylyltransferase/[glutamine synthetase]-adenylyl-L-tyrosine phosphorylase [Rhodospirillales bacterium]
MTIPNPAFAFPTTDQAGWPRVADADRARLGVARWRETTAQNDDPEVAAFAHRLADQPLGSAVLERVFANSPFLGDCLITEAAFLRTVLLHGPNQTLTTLLADFRQELSREEDRARLMRGLRIGKRRAALLAGLADIFATWSLEQVTNSLSEFAEAALSATLAHLLRKAAATGAFALADIDAPERGAGLFVLGMGKLGARELNYSSDIDLMVFYDRDRVRGADDEAIHNRFVRVVRDLVQIFEDRTADGYVFRTDLRLRPDPGITPLAMSVTVAETYYASVGQNWERAAMLKARPVAGDREAARQFLARIRPFIWRRHLDFAAIQDIHSIKRQITAHRGGGKVAIKGHNIKLGRGGIREIEFIAQTLQLIWGGREPGLRVAPTCQALSRLADAGKLERAVADDLIASYRFLRTLEHRLQMVDDKQTHSLPDSDAGVAAIAAFMGYDDAKAFAAELEKRLRAVEKRYAGLFETAPSLGGPEDRAPGNLVFTGGENDPETMQTLKRLGFEDPGSVADRVRSWHHGRFRAMRSARAREIMTELVPALLAALARTAEPDQAFARFDRFLGQLPAGVQLLSLLQSNPEVLDLLADILGSAPMLAEQLARNSLLLDSVLYSGFAREAPARRALEEELDETLRRADDFQDTLDLCRRWSNDHKFHLGVRLLRGQTDAHEAGPALTDLAEIVAARLHRRVAADFAAVHGRVPGAELAVVALGKLGAREMTVGSDLDLIFIYADAEAEASDGKKPLPAPVYFARLSQRLITALTAPTAEGALYQVDMRLRPSGNQGPIASSLQGFRKYQEADAWTWEHMALTRARAIAGPPALIEAVGEALRAVLTRERDPAKLARDVAEMRARVAREFPGRDIFDVKYVRGGLLDCDFTAQYLQLLHAHDRPRVLHPNTCAALGNLAEAGLVERQAAGELIEAAAMWPRIQGLLRLTAGAANPREAPAGVRQALARAGGAKDLGAREKKMQRLAAKARSRFAALIEAPAAGEAPGVKRPAKRAAQGKRK